ncbi:MAG: PstS family phosphate ABC transporter substrate-binding protein [Bdellovibrionales bacterium]
MLSLASLLLGCGLSASAQTQTVKIDGSSTVFPITEAVAEEFQTEKRGKIRATVGVSGTGGGFKKFCRGETDIQNASRPIQKEGEMAACKKAGIKYFELPVAYDATVVVVNPGNTFIKEITTEELKKIWEPAAQGKITKWNQVNPKWPVQEMKLYGAGADSGTFDYFTEAVVGKAKASRGDYTASEDDNVLVNGVSTDKNALGYLPYTYYSENKDKLKAVAVLNSKGKAVLPSRETVENGSYNPLSRPLFIYVSQSSYKRPEVKEFVQFYLENAPKLAEEVKAVPLPETAYALGKEALAKEKLGTAFGGHSEVGLRVDELMKKKKSL